MPRLGRWFPATFTCTHLPTVRSRRSFHRSRPARVRAPIFTFGRLTYVLEALVPLAFLPLRSWWVLMALPGAAIVLLANSGYVWRMGDHYAALWIPWLLVATIAASPRWRVVQAVALPHASRWSRAFSASSFSSRSIECTRCITCIRTITILAMHAGQSAAFRRRRRLQPTMDGSAVAAQRPRATIDRAQGVQYSFTRPIFRATRIKCGYGRKLAASCRRRVSRRLSIRRGRDIRGSRRNKIPGPGRIATLRGLLPVPFRRFREFLSAINARHQRGRFFAAMAQLRLHQRSRVDQGRLGHPAARLLEIARHAGVRLLLGDGSLTSEDPLHRQMRRSYNRLFTANASRSTTIMERVHSRLRSV